MHKLKITKLIIKVDKKRDELFLKHKIDEAQRTLEYKAEEASKNREHELRLAQIYVSVRRTSYLSQADQWHLPAYRPYICKIYLEIVKTYKQMSLGNVNICHTIIINCNHPRIEEPDKTKKKTCLKKDVFHCCSYTDVLIFIAAFFVLRQKGCFVKIMSSCFITCSLF